VERGARYNTPNSHSSHRSPGLHERANHLRPVQTLITNFFSTSLASWGQAIAASNQHLNKVKGKLEKKLFVSFAFGDEFYKKKKKKPTITSAFSAEANPMSLFYRP
jgi:hypothetical protein